MITPIDDLIDSIEMLKGKESKYRIKGFKLIKIIMPVSMIEQIKQGFNRNYRDYIPELDDGQVYTFMGVPVEKNYHIRKPQFVVEGELESL